MAVEPPAFRGGANLEARLLTIHTTLARRAMANALRSGARLLATESSRRVAVREGALKLSITVRANPKRQPGLISVVMGFKSRMGGFRAHFEEFGTSRQRARPFVRPAFYGNLDRIVDRIRESLKRAIERAARQ